jgi:hypothetical protein
VQSVSNPWQRTEEQVVRDATPTPKCNAHWRLDDLLHLVSTLYTLHPSFCVCDASPAGRFLLHHLPPSCHTFVAAKPSSPLFVVDGNGSDDESEKTIADNDRRTIIQAKLISHCHAIATILNHPMINRPHDNQLLTLIDRDHDCTQQNSPQKQKTGKMP